MFKKIRTLLGTDETQPSHVVPTLPPEVASHVRELIDALMRSPNSVANPEEAVTVRDRRAADAIRAAQLAINEMKDIGEGVVPLLAEKLGSGHYTVSNLLSQMIDPHSALEQLQPYLKSPTPQVKADTLRVLGQARAKGSLGAIIKLLDDSNDNVRYAAVQALGNLGDPAALDALKKLQGSATGRVLAALKTAVLKLEQTPVETR